MIDKSFWKDKRVFITGHTGFKGSWLSIWLSHLGARVIGYSLPPPTNPGLFELANVKQCIENHIIGDVRNVSDLAMAISENHPEIIIHMAAQPLVRDSYKVPAETYAINVMGTVNLFEAIRQYGNGIRAVINVTTDKVYENREWLWGYRENEPLGGFDPYSNSKACSELVTAAYRNSFFNPQEYSKHKVAVATARAGNVIGGGDWAADRLVPDCMNAILHEKTIHIRNPDSVRPWQFVLEPLSGYLVLAEKLFIDGAAFAEAWNFGPNSQDAQPVGELVEFLCKAWGEGANYSIDNREHPHEAQSLKLDCSKAMARLSWRPKWNLLQALNAIVRWYRVYKAKADIRAICENQIDEFQNTK